MSENQQNLKHFKIVYSEKYIQIVPLLNSFKTQILINKRTNEILFEDVAKQYEFNGDYSLCYASLILGMVEIQGDHFLIYVQNVYIQPSFPINNNGVYQIGSINYLQQSRFVSNRQKQIFNIMKTEIFNFSFYFSFQTDLTLSFQRQLTSQKKRYDQKYFWNLSMIKALMSQTVVFEWFIPVIQGHYSHFQLNLKDKLLKYYLISRRSKYRSGTRFYNRGIDENSKCSQFIETEQIMVIGQEVTSYVSLSGSVPLFWEQKSQTDKIRLTRNKQLTTIPFIEHFNSIKNEYGRVLVINLLEKKKESEKLLLQAFQQLIDENSSSFEDYLRYLYFDINESFKSKNHGDIFGLIGRIDPIIKELGFFKYNYLSKQIYHHQTGVIRTNCLDCLSRTNKFMQAINFYAMAEELYQQRLVLQPKNGMLKDLLFGEDYQIESLLVNYRNVWQQKADFESMIYTGSRAANGKKNKFLDDLSDSFISLQRLYNQKFIDESKQKALDVILYHQTYRMQSILRNKQNVPFKVNIVSWNVNATDIDKFNDFDAIIQKCDQADLFIFGLQEVIQLTTNNVVSNNQEESSSSVRWGKGLQKRLNKNGKKRIFVQKVEMVGLLVIMFVSEKWKHAIKSVQMDTVRTGMGGQFGNKGAVIIRVRIFETSLCFICAHLSAGHSKNKQRLDDFQQIHKKAFQQNKLGVQNQAQIQESHYKFFFGDLNFRVNGEFKEVKEMLDRCIEQPELKKEIVGELMRRDQLEESRKNPNAHYLLSIYEENEINFLPTYKLEKSNGKYSLEKSRIPSWCDRILFWANNQPDHSCECQLYTDMPILGSDHRPIIGQFKVIVNERGERDSKMFIE